MELRFGIRGETESLRLPWQLELYASEVPGPGRAEPSIEGYRSGVTATIATDPGPAFTGVSVKGSSNVCGAHPNVG